MTPEEAVNELTRFGQEMGYYDPPVASNGLLPCPRCRRTETLELNIGWSQAFNAAKCACGYLGPLSKDPEEAKALWNALAR